MEPDQAVVAELSHGPLDNFLVANLPAHFEHRSVMWMGSQRESEDRPLRALSVDRLAPNTLCLHRNLVSGAGREAVSAALPPFDLLDEAKLEQGGAAI
jgi:hypothetical protein